MKQDRMSPFLSQGRSILLAYDQGLEHGPSADFTDRNVDPAFVMEIATKGGFNGVVFQKGVAERFYEGKVPLIVKLNGKTSLPRGSQFHARSAAWRKPCLWEPKGWDTRSTWGADSKARCSPSSGRFRSRRMREGSRLLPGYTRGGLGSKTTLRRKSCPMLQGRGWSSEPTL